MCLICLKKRWEEFQQDRNIIGGDGKLYRHKWLGQVNPY